MLAFFLLLCFRFAQQKHRNFIDFGAFWSSGGTPGALWVQTGTGTPFLHEFRVDLDLILETLADPWASLWPPCAALLHPLPRFFDVF